MGSPRAHGNHPSHSADGRGIGNHDNDAMEEAKRKKTRLTIVESYIFHDDKRIGKDLRRINEIDAVLADICSALDLIPLKSHVNCNYNL